MGQTTAGNTTPSTLAGRRRLNPAELWAELPEGFARVVFPVGEEPFATLFYQRTGCSAILDCSSLPVGMAQELAWWLHQLVRTGERVTLPAVRDWVGLVHEISQARRRHRLGVPTSFLDLSAQEWLSSARVAVLAERGELPSHTWLRNHEPALRRLHAAVSARCESVEWWRANLWDPLHDERIPRRSHEPHGDARLSFVGIPQPWLADAMRWFFAVGLETGEHSWSSLFSYRTHLGTYFAEYLVAAGIDTPVLCPDPGRQLRTVALGFLEHLCSRPAVRADRAGKHLSAQTVGTAQSTLARFYAFMADHKDEATALLGEPRWGGLCEAHGRLWRAGELAHRRKAPPTEPRPTYLEPAVLSQIVDVLDILGLPTDQIRTLIIDGQAVEINGLGDPQGMRAYLLAMHTGRRINEILLMDVDPLEPMVRQLTRNSDADPDAFVARMRYCQTKIDGAPTTILVEQAVVDLIHEQQSWLTDHVTKTTPHGIEPATPIHLFVAAKRNRQGLRPYVAHTLHARLRRLSDIVKIHDSTGRLVDLSRTHRLRNTKATELINFGVPLHVVQRYLGHRSPEMTMHYAATLDQTHEAEFLRLARVGRDGRTIELDSRDLYEIAQLDRRTDRVLPNGVCLLPPAKHCDKGNACATCEHFATDRSHLADHREQLAATLTLIEQRRTQHRERTGRTLGDDNVWVQARLAEVSSFEAIIAALDDNVLNDATAVRGAGSATRSVASDPQPISLDTTRWRQR